MSGKIALGFELILSRLNSIDEKISDLKGNKNGNLGAIEKAFDDGLKKVIEEIKKI